MYGSGAGFFYILIAQILFFIFTFLLILWIVKHSKSENNPKKILDMKLVKGEITEEEYSHLIKIINKNKEVE